MYRNEGGPAFPRPLSSLSSEEVAIDQEGMTLRDYFAARALPVLMKQADVQVEHPWDVWAKRVSEMAYEMADAMLAEREK
jgi:hypothetical protein